MDGSSIPNSPYEAMNHSWLVILNCLILGCSPKFWCFSLDFCWWNGRKTYKVEAGRYISWFCCTHLQGGASYEWLKSSHDSTTSIYKNHSEIGNLMKTTWIYITNLKTMKTIDISWYINKHFRKLIVIPVINHSQWDSMALSWLFPGWGKSPAGWFPMWKIIGKSSRKYGKVPTPKPPSVDPTKVLESRFHSGDGASKFWDKTPRFLLKWISKLDGSQN